MKCHSCSIDMFGPKVFWIGEDRLNPFCSAECLAKAKVVLGMMRTQDYPHVETPVQPAEIRDGKRVHTLKSWPQWYERIRNGDLTSNVRKFDRDFRRGDWILFQEYDPMAGGLGKYTGLFTAAQITDVLTGQGGIADGYCVLSIKLPAGASGFSLDLQENA